MVGFLSLLCILISAYHIWCMKLYTKKVKELEIWWELNHPATFCKTCESVLRYKNEQYRQLLEDINKSIDTFITYTEEYSSCYYKNECGKFCTPKREGKIMDNVCVYHELDKMQENIKEILNDK